MHRRDLLEKLSSYVPAGAAERACRDRFIAFVQAEPECFERTLLKGHVTGSAWIVEASGRRVLLTHHRKLGKWLQLGGHADGDPDVLAVALREAREESGIEGLVPVWARIFDLDIHLIPARPGEPEHEHYDVRFVLRAPARASPVLSSESIELAWFGLDEIETLRCDESVLRMKRKWAQSISA
jgi:8-oxo-dGTP pyrophosphatase MutT (NUDIX family)